MAADISPLASVDPQAEIADDATIGPFCTVGPHVHIGSGTKLLNNVTLMGHVRLGCDNTVYPNVVLGGEPQDVSYRGSNTRVVIGDRNIFREGVTVNRASEKEDGVTWIGDDNFLMANSHVAHDCKLGNHILIANGSLLAGHVHVHDHASVSGNSAIHHYVSVGSYCFVAAMCKVLHDAPPYMLVEGIPARPRCINIVAMKRKDFHRDVIDALAAAHRLLYRTKVGVQHAREILQSNEQMNHEVEHLLAFVEGQQEGHHGRRRELVRKAA